ncbi:MAG: hypothetical protein HPY76_05915 [Anaerolineae bacterium]|nr:hypothetical protein [Anaerolineae bacterium]
MHPEQHNNLEVPSPFILAIKKIGLVALAGLLLALLATFIIFDGSMDTLGANLFWSGVAMIAIGAGLDAGDFISHSSMFRFGQAIAKKKSADSDASTNEDKSHPLPNLFIFLIAGILTIAIGTIFQLLF